MYPSKFGLIDEFVVRALREVEGLPEAAGLVHRFRVSNHIRRLDPAP
jgi:hypothetical protein